MFRRDLLLRLRNPSMVCYFMPGIYQNENRTVKLIVRGRFARFASQMQF